MPNEIAQLSSGVPFITTNGFDNAPAQMAVESAILRWMVPSNSMIAPYWSMARDSQLRGLWRTIDPFKIAVTTFVNKAVTIPLNINPSDRNIRAHVRQAQEMRRDLQRNSGMMAGWKHEFKRFMTDYLTQDNGAFLLIMGKGSASRPILGQPMGVYHLDSALCQRTGDPEFPVVYVHTDGQRYRLHYTRVILVSNLPSPEADLFGVGHCAISCALDAGMEIRDVYAYVQEKLGSRPKRQILYAKKGTTRTQMIEAIDFADQKMDGEGLTRFSKTVIMAPKNANGELELGVIDLASTPDNFDRMQVQLIDLSSIAAAFGLDLQDIVVSYGISGGTRAAAEVQERKGRGKGVGELLETVQEQIDEKLLPEHLYSSFDNQDDMQDEQQAKIWDMRSTARQRDLTTGSTTVSVERARMLRNGEITEEEYEQMELIDGRLPNGLDVLSLFFSADQLTKSFLDLGVDDPTRPELNTPDSILSDIALRQQAAYAALEVVSSRTTIRRLFQILAALEKLNAVYVGYKEQQEAMRAQEEQRQQLQDQLGAPGLSTKPAAEAAANGASASSGASDGTGSE